MPDTGKYQITHKRLHNLHSTYLLDDLKIENFLKSFKFSQMSMYRQKHYPNDS